MILHVNPIVEEYSANGTEDKPFNQVRHAADYAHAHGIPDWRIRYYHEEINSWIFLK